MRFPVGPNTWKKLRFATVAVCLLLGLAEVGMQVVRAFHPDIFQLDSGISGAYSLPTDPQLLFRMPAGESVMKGVDVRINSLGWRGPEPSTAKPPGVYRVMFFGDSTVFGDGVEEELSFAHVTGRMLADQLDREVEVINASVPGYSSTQCRILFEDHADRLLTDAVVLAPLWSDIIVRPWTDGDLLRKFSSEGYRFESVTRRFLRHSAFFCLMEARFERSRGIPDDRMVVYHSVVNKDVRPSASGAPRVSIGQHRDNLRSMCSHAMEREMDVVLVLLQCDPTLFSWREDQLTAYRRNYEETAKDFGVSLVDVRGIFPEDPDMLTGLFLDGIHPTAEGHALIAAEVFEAMRTAPGLSGRRGSR